MIEIPIARKKVFVNGLCAHEEKRSKVKVSQIIFSTELMKWVINRRIYAFFMSPSNNGITGWVAKIEGDE